MVNTVKATVIAAAALEPQEDAVRARLRNWGDWQRALPPGDPASYPTQPMFREMKSAYSAEYASRNRPSANVDDAMQIEKAVCMLSDIDKSVLVRYFIFDQNTITCSKKLMVSQRKFERWLNVAIGKITVLADLIDELQGIDIFDNRK